jgi:hypothetical protein
MSIPSYDTSICRLVQLIDSKCIPCILPNGKHEELSIKETFERVSEIQEIFDPSPSVTVAIHRLLLETPSYIFPSESSPL